MARLDTIDRDLRPPEPQLLDTCAIQNLDWVDRKREQGNGNVDWDAPAVEALTKRFGAEMAQDLLDLGSLYTEFEERGGYPWLVCIAAMDEAGAFAGSKGPRVRQMVEFLALHQGDWDGQAYPGIAHGLLLDRKQPRISPLILRGLGVSAAEEVYTLGGPLGFLPDEGDRRTAAYAMFANIPAIVTTDRRTFLAHRERLFEFGVAVFRPSELLPLYDVLWEVEETEFRRRRAEAPRPVRGLPRR